MPLNLLFRTGTHKEQYKPNFFNEGIIGRVRRGGVHWVHVHPPPLHLGKSFQIWSELLEFGVRFGIRSALVGHRRNQLFGYIHYLTEINVNLLLNTCKFHRKFRLISLLIIILSENAPNVDFTEAKFQNFPGEHAPDPPCVPAPLALDLVLVESTLYCFRRAWNCMQLTVWKTIIWIYPLLYWNFWNKYQFAAKYMQFSP